jgi:thioredoxin-like negative regulator of GroEL
LPQPPRASARLWLYRALAAVVFPAVLLLVLEGGLRIAGFGQSVRFLVPDANPGYFRTNPEFVSSFLPSNFELTPLNLRVSRVKRPNTVRIVVLGESAAQGVPMPAFGFAPQLRAQLRARYPGKEIEVINTGIVAINSHVVYQIAREMSGFSPDLFVVYMGNNEVVGPYGPGCAYLSEMPPLWVIRLSVFVRSTRTGQLMTAILGRLTRRDKEPAEWGGMSMFVNNAVSGDDPRLEAVYRNFEANLLCTVASNIKDCAPFLSIHGAGLTDSELNEWGRAFNSGRIEWLLGLAGPARTDLEKALRLDPKYADTAFMLGSLDIQAGNMEAARSHLIDAEHWDALRFRPDPRINEIIRKVARENAASASLVDTAELLGSDPTSSAVPAGRGLFFEHVHPDWDGNYQLARSMAEGAETVLFGAKKSGFEWLDSYQCAAALAYTAHERLSVLQKIAPIIQNPPFTNQLTYCEDQARLAHELARAKADKSDPEKLGRAKEEAAAASAKDPDNADLAKIEEEIDDDEGDVGGALAEARRAEELQPRNFALTTDEAIKLSRLGRYDEAESLLNKTAASSSPRELALMAPAYSDIFTRTGRFAEGRRYLDAEISRRPDDESLRLVRGRLAQLSSDNASAEREFRAVLSANPSSQGALEALVQLLNGMGLTAASEKEVLAAVDYQPRNQANNLRAAVILDAHGNGAQSIRCLLAAERSGPMPSEVELHLAQELFKLKRLDEALEHLAEARRISICEGNPAATESIGRIIGHILSQMH